MLLKVHYFLCHDLAEQCSLTMKDLKKNGFVMQFLKFNRILHY